MTGRFVLRPGRFGYAWVSLTVAVATWFSLLVDDPGKQPAPPWAALAATVFGMAVFWRVRAIPRERRFAGLLATFLLVFVAGALVAGVSPGRAAWMSATNLFVALGLAWYYRRKNSIDDWAPGTANDAIMLCATHGVAAAVLVALGGLPPAGEPLAQASGGLMGYLAAALLLQVSTRPSVSPSRFRPADVPLAIVAVAAAILPYLVPQYPLSWIIFIPALWLGLTFPPRVVAACASTGVLTSMLATSAPYWRTPVDLGLPPYVLMQALQWIAAALALVISYQREDTARLENELVTRRIRTATDNAILDGVFRAMHDGVLVADPDGTIVMTNHAARSMLDLPPHTDAPGSLASVLDALRHPDGSVMPPGALQRFLSCSDEEHGLHASIATQRRSTARSLALASVPIALSPRPYRLILIRDTSAQQERQHQLKSFARSVAQDLSAPLESLSESIGVIQDLLWDDDVTGGRAALVRTIRSATAIRSLIDDHVAATLAREGVIRPASVELAPLVKGAAWACDREGIALDVQPLHTVYADLSLTRQLVTNLVQYAVERAQEGQRAAVRIVSEQAPEPGWVTVTFADRNLGPPSYDGTRPAGPAGSTADAFAANPRLALCHTIVTRHGGRLRAEPNNQGGSTVTFTLPAA